MVQKKTSSINLKVKIVGANFLFPSDICDYLNEIADRMYELKVVEHKIRSGVENREDVLKAHKKEYQWLEAQPIVLAAKLKLYLELTI